MNDYTKNTYIVKAIIVEDKDDNFVDEEVIVYRLAGKRKIWVHGEERIWVMDQVRNEFICENVAAFMQSRVKLPYRHES